MMTDPFAPREPSGEQHGYATPPGYGPPPQGNSNGFGVTSMVLGIISLVLFVTTVPAVILGVLAVIFGILGRGKVSRREADNGGMALTGIITGSIGATIGLLIIFYYLNGPAILA